MQSNCGNLHFGLNHTKHNAGFDINTGVDKVTTQRTINEQINKYINTA